MAQSQLVMKFILIFLFATICSTYAYSQEYCVDAADCEWHVLDDFALGNLDHSNSGCNFTMGINRYGDFTNNPNLTAKLFDYEK